MGFWEQENFAEEITEILKDVPEQITDQFNYPFMTGVQIAHELVKRKPELLQRNPEIDEATKTSRIARFITLHLTSQIKAGEINHIEAGFLSNWHLQEFLHIFQQVRLVSDNLLPLINDDINFVIFRYKA